MTIADRVKQKRIDLKLTQAELAKRVGITQQSLQKIEDGRTQNPRKLINLAKELHCNPEWLLMGSISEVNEPPSNYHNTNSKLSSKQTNLRPIVTFEQAAKWSQHNTKTIEYENWLDAPESTPVSAFWLKVSGDSMNASSGISIPEGYFILVDPSLSANNGDLVIAKLARSNEATFKKLFIDAGQIYLTPLNPNYKPIEVSSAPEIIGVVTQARFLL
ncbi:LexA family transcriptional repressor [Marinomonas sp. CT5]|uniref:LexA family protein n=1 Tax=Marinomonas sp. CT5 TaxID=2066133 RepID=UPI001BAF3AE0|nr:XRE family transcriptional regulator [Marinomonas sp. CT5]QUX96146.1 LexA family transcriptional repressor [Marinomonas sp. CT5]